MIPVRKLADLDLSAASGLVRLGKHLLVVADDELFLDAYALDGRSRAARIAFPSRAVLPDGEGRKRLKPDLESLVVLPGGRVLATGSGSTDRRRTAFLFAAGPGDAAPSFRATVDLTPLFEHLLGRIPELNLEGAAVCGKKLKLLQRGNSARGQNAVIDLALDGVLGALDHGRPLGANLVENITQVNLGLLDKVRLGFTDASPLPGDDSRIAFTAAAEDTDDPYLDGACAGSALGVLDAAGKVEWAEQIEGTNKIEGLTVEQDGRVLLVADPDDRSRRAPLFEARPGRLQR